MNKYKYIIFGMAVAGIVSELPVARAQTMFQSYHCADGTNFIVGFYPHDSRAYLQIDGRPVTLKRRLALSGTRYAGGGVTLKIDKAGASTVKHARRPGTACQLN
jgi:membrane-bound inhibitor of C-type lysozyme